MTEPTDRFGNAEDDIDLDSIIHNAVASVNLSVPKHEPGFRVRLLIFVAGLIVALNTVIGVYNSIAVRSEISCNHQLQNTLTVLADQNRVITRRVIDVALSGQNPTTGKQLTRKDLITVKNQYDRAFEHNQAQREELLQTTCSDGASVPDPSPSSVGPS